MASRRLSRRAVLGAGAGLLLGGCWGGTDQPPRPGSPSTPPEEHTIFDLSFTLESRYRPFELIATEQGSEPEATPEGLQLTATGPEAPFCTVEATVTASSGRVLLGLAGDAGHHVVGFYDADSSRVGVEVRTGGRTRVIRRKRATMPGSFRFAFVLCENQVTLLADTGDGWQPLLTERDKVRALVDLRDPSTLGNHRYSFGSDAGSTSRVTEVRWGLFGMTGLRDQHLVQHSDGRPYVKNGKAYFTATCAGLGFFQQAHWAVFTLDLARPDRLEQVAQLYFLRDGLLLGDHAGQIVRDDDTDQWIVATSSWGDFDFAGVHVRHTVTPDDVLHGVHVLETERTALPTEQSSWDPGMTKIDGRWHVGFVESPSQKPFDFHPALAAAPEGAAWGEKLELVGAATDLHQTEGPIIAQVQDSWWFLASDGDARHYPVFDLSMRRVGRLDAPYETNIPHPQLVPLEGEGAFLLVTFDGTQYAERLMGYGGHGDVLIMRSRA
jgi:hypothetical protein